MRGAGVALLAALALATGCGDASLRPTDMGPRLEAAPETFYGDAEGPGALSAVFDVAVSDGGRVYVSEPGFGRVVAFEEDGAFAGVVGRPGEGPGEFRAPAKLGWLGDTLTVLDFGRGISLLGEDGAYHGQVSFRRASPGSGFPLHPFVLLGDGSVAAMSPISTGLAAEGAVAHERWVRTTREGETLDTLLLRELRGKAFVLEMDGRRGAMTHPLAFDPLHMAAPDGSSFLLVERLPVVAEGGAAFRVLRLDPGGDTVAAATFPYRPVVVDGTARDSIAGALARKRARSAGFSEARLRTELLAQLPWPPHRPPVTELVAGMDGTVWLRREVPARDSVRWEILDPELRPLGHVLLPEGLEVKAARADEVWGVALDEMEVPTVVRYRLERSPTDGSG